MIIDYGAPVVAVWPGAPVGGTYAVAITRPDGTSFTPPQITTGPPTSVTFTPNMAGRWMINWTSTVEPGGYSDIVDVWPTDPKFLISLDDARQALSMPPNTDPAKLDELRLYVAAATPIIEDIVGPVLVTSYTQTIPKGWTYGALYNRAASITTVKFADGTTVPTTAYTANAGHGLITFNYAQSQDVVVTYASGDAIIPPNVRLATRVLVKHMWQVDKQDLRNRENPAQAWTPSGYAVPKRVLEMCQPNTRKVGFA